MLDPNIVLEITEIRLTIILVNGGKGRLAASRMAGCNDASRYGDHHG
jgi:hypothetical protein